MALYDLAHLVSLETELRIRPTVVSYSRLEPVNLSSGDLTPGLEVRLADPLWMIGRQWQFEELRGEDGGSPVVAEVNAERGPVTRFHPGSPLGTPDSAGESVDVPPATPVEVAVEAETPDVHPERVRSQLGLHLLRLTRALGLPTTILAKVEAAYVAEWPFAGDLDAEVDPVGASRRRVLTGRVPDGAAAVAALRASGGDLPSSVSTAAGTAARRTAVKEVLATWRTWAEQLVAVPTGSSWDPHRLEYSFAVQATLSTGDVVLRSDEYVGGTVDWYSFDAAASPALGAPAQPVPPEVVRQTLVPTPVKYPGMPNDRLWAFEDSNVYLGGLKAGSTDLARLALVEFSLVFGNDWFLLPFQMEYGDVARVHSLRVVDTFGASIDVGPSREVGRPGWTVFQNTPVDDGSALADVFVLPATLRHALEGPPLEEVALFRDEMANLVWGVERVVQGPSGEPVKRGLVESRSLRQQLPGDLDDAAIVYRLMTPVPDHWIPFVSVPLAGVPLNRFATELERRPMVRFLPGGTVEVVHPHGVLLRTSPEGDVAADRLRIAEQEVPRDGVVLTRRYQLARTTDGGTVLWIGRRKEAGQGEGSSGLKFDTALPPDGL
ncbi:MAG: uncharacterized protein JWR90_2182 [Marmoricola sp.]|nr:uncharacterized protein [Marmoricola sp.]